MNQLKTIPNKEFLQELKNRVEKKKLSQGEIFSTLKTPAKPEVITEYKKTGYSQLIKEDWKKASETLKKNKNYQEEAKLWDSIDDE